LVYTAAVRPAAWLWIVVTIAACHAAAPRAERAGTSVKSETRSNSLRRDYAGSAACAGCHADIARAWTDSPMHRLTRDASRTEIAAPFDGRSLDLAGDRLRLVQDQGQRFLELSRAGVESRFRITKVIGGRYREDVVGEEVLPTGAGPQRVMPVSFLRFDGTLRYKGYSVMVKERAQLEPGLVWQRACILCHNTAPQLVALYDELYGAAAPSYQGSASNELPEDRAFRYVIDDADGLARELESELRLLGARGSLPNRPRHALEIAISNTRERFDEHALVELGVSCESCHGGARAHAQSPSHLKTSFGVRSELLHVESATGQPLTAAQEQNRSCAKCHTVLFSQYPFTWEGGERRDHPGGSTTNSGEARDFLLGGCSAAMTCATCHDPHGQDSRERLDELMTPRGNRVCVTCHGPLSEPSALRKHSHHAPEGAAGGCLSCHMPRKNMGLAYELTAYHRIGSPTDTARVEGDRPLECTLCHADRSVDQIVSTMEKWWGKRYERSKLKRLYGVDLRQNTVKITLLGGKPHEQVVAADIAARHALPGTVDATVALLGNPYPLVRYFAKHSLDRRLGAPLALDMNLPGPALIESAQRALAARPAPSP
jgi:predicted CXXCH cytochrome family protein